MNTYKLSNIIKKEFLKDEHNRYKNLKKQKFSFAYLKNLFNTYYVSEWTTFEYCCRGEDFNCWIEVNSSWMPRNLSDKEHNAYIYKQIKYCVNKTLTEKEIGNRSIFISETKKHNCIVVCIPLRDKVKYDQWLVFDKKHLI